MSVYKLTQVLIGISILSFILQIQLKEAAFLAGVGLVSWFITNTLIPKIRSFMIGKDIFGFDINKKGS